MAKPYAVHEARAKLSEILRKVKRGHSITIMERGKEIARVVPFERSGAPAARLAQLDDDCVILRGDPDAPAIRPIARRPGALRRFLKSRS